MKNIFIFVLFSVLPFSVWSQNAVEEDQGVYEYVVSPAKMSFPQAVTALQKSFAQANLRILSSSISKSPGNCNFKANVFILYDSLYAEQLLKLNPATAPFALFDRINLFEDENGIHLSLVNPDNILRTILMDDSKYIQFAETHKQRLRKIISSGMDGLISHKQYGEIRDEGYIGRTMGIMAGGDFNKKIETIAYRQGVSINQALMAINASIKGHSGKWQIEEKYHFILPEKSLAIIGFSSPLIESTSFDIVQEGSDDSREDFKCPGIAHAAAYPFQIVITASDSGVQIKMVEAMYRMKLFFEDAGMMAFAKNMTMPGSIQDEVESIITEALKEK